DGFAVVPKSLLCEPFGVAGFLGAFRPGIPVRMQRDAFDSQTNTTLVKFERSPARTLRRYGNNGPRLGSERSSSAVSSSNRISAIDPVFLRAKLMTLLSQSMFSASRKAMSD